MSRGAPGGGGWLRVLNGCMLIHSIGERVDDKQKIALENRFELLAPL